MKRWTAARRKLAVIFPAIKQTWLHAFSSSIFAADESIFAIMAAAFIHLFILRITMDQYYHGVFIIRPIVVIMGLFIIIIINTVYETENTRAFVIIESRWLSASQKNFFFGTSSAPINLKEKVFLRRNAIRDVSKLMINMRQIKAHPCIRAYLLIFRVRRFQL